MDIYIYITRDTELILDGQFNRESIEMGFSLVESPIFDSLAADRFASDRGTFNLGDYR